MLSKNNYKLFTKADFINMIGKDLDEELANEDVNNASDYLIAYVSNQINAYIMKRTSRRLFKVDTSTDYDIYYGYRNAVFTDARGVEHHTGHKLNENQKELLKLACVYQADYIITGGSSERMNGVSLASRTSILKKEELDSYEVCNIAVSMLTEAGLLYAGRGRGAYAWFE